jgi:hypothetical protein
MPGREGQMQARRGCGHRLRPDGDNQGPFRLEHPGGIERRTGLANVDRNDRALAVDELQCY